MVYVSEYTSPIGQNSGECSYQDNNGDLCLSCLSLLSCIRQYFSHEGFYKRQLWLTLKCLDNWRSVTWENKKETLETHFHWDAKKVER